MAIMLKGELIKKLHVLSSVVWEGRLNETKINRWLSNFEPERSKFPSFEIDALYLLSNFIYFGNAETRELLKSMYRDLYRSPIIRKIREELDNTTNLTVILERFKEEQSKTRFLPVGNPSESGSHLLYYFRQENRLPKDLFLGAHEIFKTRAPSGIGSSVKKMIARWCGPAIELRYPDVNHYVFVDDFCGSGDQGTSYSENIISSIKTLNPEAKADYLVLFALPDGLSQLRTKTRFDSVQAIFELDDSFKCFSSKSRYFASPKATLRQASTKAMCQFFGKKLLPLHPLGYKDGQLLLGFHHNVPDNTLPVIWFDEPEHSWKAIFPRFPKVYGE